MSSEGITLRVPSISGAFHIGQSALRAAIAVPRAGARALRSLPDLADTLAYMVDPEGPLRQIDDAIIALAGLKGIADALDKIGDMETALNRLADLQDELETLGTMQASLDVIASLHDPITSLAKTTEALPELADAAEALPRLVDQVGAVRQVVSHIGLRIDELAPALEQIAEFGVGLEHEIDDLGAALAPIAGIASKLPGGRKAAKAAARQQAAQEAATRDAESAGSANGASARAAELTKTQE